MPAYSQSFTDAELSALLDHGPVKVASVDDLAHMAARLEALDEWVHSMEVVQVNGPGRIDLSMMGLDGEDDWDIPLEPVRMRALLAAKIDRMRATGAAFTMDVYMGETAD